MMDFTYLETKLNKKKKKKGKDNYFGKPIVERHGNMLCIWYNYYYATILYDEDYTMPRPLYRPYRLDVEKPCAIQQNGAQYLGTAFTTEWLADQEEVWNRLQRVWSKTIF